MHTETEEWFLEDETTFIHATGEEIRNQKANFKTNRDNSPNFGLTKSTHNTNHPRQLSVFCN